MKVIKPVTFDSATHLVSSTAVEAYAAYNPATTYAKDAFVDYGTFIYQSLVNSNTGNQPDISPTQWVLIGPDNTHAMFDDQTSTATTSTSPLTVVLDTGLCNSLGLLGLVGSQVVVTVRDDTGGNTVYSRTISLDGTFIYDWYQYFFEPYVQIGEVVLTDLPPYLTAELTVSLTGTGTIQIGTLTWGTQYDLGDATYGAGLGIIDYSKKETDEFGVTTFVRREFQQAPHRQADPAQRPNQPRAARSGRPARPAGHLGHQRRLRPGAAHRLRVLPGLQYRSRLPHRELLLPRNRGPDLMPAPAHPA
jgi:hypothetical protein